MRLWSLHPKYLDVKGLTAAWREGLLAQKVLRGKTRGYRNHPQLERFKKCRYPERALAAYLEKVCMEAEKRGYVFTRGKIGRKKMRGRMAVTRGQRDYELRHLAAKLRERDPGRFRALCAAKRIELHPLFYLRSGPVETWEKIRRAS